MLLKNLGAAKNHHFLWIFSWQSPRGALGCCLSGHVWPHPAPPWCALDILDLGVPVVRKMRQGRFLMAPETSAAPNWKKKVFSPLMIAFLVCRNLLFPSWGQSWTLLHIFLRKTRYKKNRHSLKQFWISGIPWYWEFWSQNRQNKLDGSAVLAHHNFENLYPHRIPIYSQSDPILFTIIPRTKTTLSHKITKKNSRSSIFLRMAVAFFSFQDALWNLITYCAATGGSLLVIGSAAGVAFMGMAAWRMMGWCVWKYHQKWWVDGWVFFFKRNLFILNLFFVFFCGDILWTLVMSLGIFSDESTPVK